MKMCSATIGSLVPSTLIVYQELIISYSIPLFTTELTAAVSSFCLSAQVYVAFRGIVLMIARKRWSFSTV